MKKLLLFCFFGFLSLFFQALSPVAAEGFAMHRAINVATLFTWPRYEAPPKTGLQWPPFVPAFEPVTAQHYKDLKNAGFDTVRLPVDPAPLIYFTGDQREQLYKELLQAVQTILDAGLNVVFDIHPNSRHAVWGEKAIAAGTDTPFFKAYQDMLGEVARRLEPFGEKRVAIELINEPRVKCAGAEQEKWNEYLRQFIAGARSGSKKLWLVVTGACISSIEGLIALDPKILNDKRLIYTFHYYEPFPFTHQGAAFIAWPEKYLSGVPFPPTERSYQEVWEQASLRIDTSTRADLKETAAKEVARQKANAVLQGYYKKFSHKPLFAPRLDLVSQWTQKHNINPRHVFLGEFGVWRGDEKTLGARCVDRVRWHKDLISEVEKRGFSWAFFSYNGPFALVNNDKDRKIDQDILIALHMKKGEACKGKW